MQSTTGHFPVATRREAPLRAGWLRLFPWFAFFTITLAPSALRAQTTLYWDINGNTAGSGSSTPSATWSTSGSDKNWSTNSGGTAGDNKWTSGSIAVFSAGTDATGAYTVTISGSQTTAGVTVEEGSPTFTGGTLILSGATPTFSVASTSTLTVNSLLSSTTGFTKTGTGTMVLGNASNAFTGTTAINAGTLKLAASNTLSPNSNLTIASGATVDFDWGHSATIGALSGAGILDIKNGTLTVGNSGNTTFSGVITDSGGYGGIVKNGTGTLTLTGTNTFAGQINITAGAVNLQNSDALGGNTYGNTIGSGAALQLQNNIVLNEGSFNLNGTGIGNTGALRNISGSNTFTGAVVMASAATIGADAGTLNLTADVSLAYQLTLTGAGNINLTGAIYGSNGLTLTGTGTTTFSGSSSNSFNGALNIDSGTLVLNKATGQTATNGAAINIGNGVGGVGTATLTLGAANQIPDSTTLVTVNSDGRFNLNNLSETIDSFTSTGQVDLGTTGKLSVGVNGGSATIAGNTTLGTGLIGTGTLEKLGNGALTFNSSINFSGTLLLAAGTLALNGYSLTVGTLHITGNSVLDFGNSSASTLNATNFIIDSGVTLTITNWVNTVDFFYVQNWSGVTHGAMGSTPENQISFSGFTSGNTNWGSDNQITPISPVPEPATYGALFLALATALVAYRRSRLA